MSYCQTLRVQGRTFIAGDLHGCLTPLESILAGLQFSADKGDVCILLGDLTDRGPDSPSCLQLLDKPGFYSIQGNHEQMLCAALRDGDALAEYCWVRNGGNWFYELPKAEQQQICPHSKRGLSCVCACSMKHRCAILSKVHTIKSRQSG